ncbi:MAG: tRNA lysidine(34) synthetase TilS [Limisphaerales bacterium]
MFKRSVSKKPLRASGSPAAASAGRRILPIAQARVSVALPGLRLPERGQKILVAVSGGLDSMVLLHALNSLAFERRWNLAVAHFNHRLRGPSSDADEAFVAEAARAMKLPFFAAGKAVREIAARKKVSIEMAARQLRHEFLARTARERSIKTIALAHHAGDQVELFFLRLLRGAGSGGLAGMQWRSPSPADERTSLVRPLLSVSRAALEHFAAENAIRYREDATNRVRYFLRNRIRHGLLPLLRQNYQPGLNRTILRCMDIAGAESNLIDALARAWLGRQPFWRRAKRKTSAWPPIASAVFEQLPLAVQRRVMTAQIIELAIAPDFELVESLRLSPRKPVSVSPGLCLFRDEAGKVSRRQVETAAFDEHRRTVHLKTSARTIFDGVELKWKFGLRQKYIHQRPKPAGGAEFFDADKIGKDIVLRHWRAGDRFQPIGLNRAVKLQDLFINAKVPRERRHKLIVAETDGGIFWIEGLRISDVFKLAARTKRALLWKWRRL